MKLQPHVQKACDILSPVKNDIKNVLNVGINCDKTKMDQKDSFKIIAEQLNIDPVIVCLELYKPYVEFGPIKYPDCKFVHGDIRDFNKLFKEEFFDLVFWWHGPEHIKMHEIMPLLKKIEAKSKHVLLGSPEGYHPQGPDGENVFDKHISGPGSKFYKALGYDSYIVEDNPLACVAYKKCY